MKMKAVNYERQRERAKVVSKQPSVCSWEEPGEFPGALRPLTAETLSSYYRIFDSIQHLLCSKHLVLWEMSKIFIRK